MVAPKNPRAKRNADDTSALPDLEESAPTREPSTLRPEDLAPEIPMFASNMGGVLGAAEIEGEIGTPEEFLDLSIPARYACRLRAGGTKPGAIASMMNYSGSSISALTNSILAKKYIAWLQERMDWQTGTVNQGMMQLLPAAYSRLDEIVRNSKNEGLVAKCSFQLFDRVLGKATEKLEITTNGALTAADIAGLKAKSPELDRVLNQE